MDKGGNPYIHQQMPEDFADYLIGLQDAQNSALEEAACFCEKKEETCGDINCRCVTGKVAKRKSKFAAEMAARIRSLKTLAI